MDYHGKTSTRSLSSQSLVIFVSHQPKQRLRDVHPTNIDTLQACNFLENVTADNLCTLNALHVRGTSMWLSSRMLWPRCSKSVSLRLGAVKRCWVVLKPGWQLLRLLIRVVISCYTTMPTVVQSSSIRRLRVSCFRLSIYTGRVPGGCHRLHVCLVVRPQTNRVCNDGGVKRRG